MIGETTASANESTNASLAPKWHTAALVALILSVALTGTLLPHAGDGNGHASGPQVATRSLIALRYLPLLIVNWSLCAYCCWPFGKRRQPFDLLGAGWNNMGRMLGDLALAGALLMLILVLEFASARLFAVRQNAAITSLLPSTVAERLTWVLVAVSVGLCEEVVYRGYLRRQIGAFTNSAALGVIAQAALFGLAHLEQGPALALRIGAYGLLFGLLAQFRRSLLPGIVCHVLLDLAAVFLR